MKTLVIAEAAACHDGDLGKALRLVDLAADIGADAVKFQYLSSAERLCARRSAPTYLASYRLLELPEKWLGTLRAHCEERGVEFMATCYLPEDIAMIAPYVTRFKVASFEAGDREFVMAHEEYARGKEVIISLGMNGRSYFPTHRVRLLHCVSAYPAPVEEMNLAVIGTDYGDDLTREGLSDHTRHPWTGALAVMRGAEIIEFHVRLDDTDPNNADYAVARTPREAAEYVANIRLAELMLGDGRRRVMPSEEWALKYRSGA